MRNANAVRIIAAVAANGVIGASGGMPWSPRDYPSEMKHFRASTTREGANTVIMGRGTWDSLPERYRPLPERHNLVLSRDPGFEAPGADAFTSLDDAIEAAGTDAWIIGGGRVYAEAIEQPYVDELVLSLLDQAHVGDVRFPAIPSVFRFVGEERRDDYTIITYRRKH